MNDIIELKRDIGFWGAYTIGLGTMIGAGVFILPGIVYGDAGPASIFSFILGGLISLVAALSLSELSTALPQTGGSYHYINRALGNLAGGISGLMMWIGLIFATSFYMLGFGEYLAYFFGDMPVALAALLMAIFLVLVNVYGVRETGMLQTTIVSLLVGLILVFTVFGIPQITVNNFSPFNPHGWSNVAMTIGTVYVSFIGFEVIAAITEEVKNPKRNVPLAMIASVITPMILYVLVMVVSIGILPAGFEETFVPVADVAREYMGEIGTVAMVIGAIFATVSSANSSLLAASRINFAMGRDKILTNWLNKIHRKFKTPYKSILVTGFLLFILISFDGIVGIGVNILAEIAGFAYLVTYSLVHVSLIVMRKFGESEYTPSFKCPGYPYVQIVGFLAAVLVLFQMDSIVIAVGTLIAMFGIIWYFVYIQGRTEEGGALVRELNSIEASKNEEDRFKILVAISNINTERELIRVASSYANSSKNVEIIALNVLETPPQTPLAQSIAFEEERIERRKELLEGVKNSARDMNLDIKTRAIVSRNVSKTILDVVEEENIDHLVLGWRGERGVKGHILGTKLDPIVKNVKCELSLVKPKEENDKGEGVVGLIGEGPNTPTVVKQAKQLSEQKDIESPLTLLNVQIIDEESDKNELKKRGKELIEKMAVAGGLNPEEYEAKVILGKNRKGSLLKATENYEILCIGAVRRRRLKDALFGSLPEEIGQNSTSTVVMIRRPIVTPRSVLKKLIKFFQR